MSSHFKRLNLPIPFVINELMVTSNRRLTKLSSKLILNHELMQLLSSFGLNTSTTIILYYPGTIDSSNVHIDDIGICDQTNLNFVIDTGSAMTNWYSPHEGYYGDTSKNTVANTISYDINRLHLLESVNAVGIGLFQGGVPHNVNSINSDRWCVSVKLKTSDYQPLKWGDAVKIFEKYIVS